MVQLGELRSNRTDDVLEIFEVAIVQATTACELPHSLDRVKFGTAWGVKSKAKSWGVCCSRHGRCRREW